MRTRTIWITSAVAIGVIAAGGTAVAVAAATNDPAAPTDDFSSEVSDDSSNNSTANQLSEDETAAALSAALDEVGPGELLDIDVDDNVSYAYELDILLDAGGLVEVKLDEQFSVVAVEDDDTPTGPTLAPPADVDPGDLDRAVAAALEYTGGGTVSKARQSDDADHVWEVEITFPDGEDVDVELDGEFNVVKAD